MVLGSGWLQCITFNVSLFVCVYGSSHEFHKSGCWASSFLEHSEKMIHQSRLLPGIVVSLRLISWWLSCLHNPQLWLPNSMLLSFTDSNSNKHISLDLLSSATLRMRVEKIWVFSKQTSIVSILDISSQFFIIWCFVSRVFYLFCCAAGNSWWVISVRIHPASVSRFSFHH